MNIIVDEEYANFLKRFKGPVGSVLDLLETLEAENHETLSKENLLEKLGAMDVIKKYFSNSKNLIESGMGYAEELQDKRLSEEGLKIAQEIVSDGRCYKTFLERCITELDTHFQRYHKTLMRFERR